MHYEVKENLATRAFATYADILLCDEPFSGPDESTAGRLLGEFVQLVKENGQDGRVHHSLDSEAVEIGDVVLRRPAMIAYDVSFDKDTPLEGRMMIRSGSEKFWRLSLRQLKHAPMPSTELTA